MITKDTVLSIGDENISRKNYKKTILEISDRVDKIWRFICAKTKRSLSWWDYSQNDYFDLEYHSEYVTLTGDWLYINDVAYLDGFETELLWDENWKATILENIEKTEIEYANKKIKTEEKRKRATEKKNKLIAIIKGKLTKEELRIVKFT